MRNRQLINNEKMNNTKCDGFAQSANKYDKKPTDEAKIEVH